MMCLGLPVLWAQGPQVKGSFPRDGSSDLMRNAFVAVGIDWVEREVGIDPESLHPQSVYLLPTSHPEDTVEAFLMANTALNNLTLEPKELLEENTEYIFGITAELKDREGRAFAPFEMRFSTGIKALPKRVSDQRPVVMVIPSSRELPPPPVMLALPSGYKKNQASVKGKAIVAQPVATATTPPPATTSTVGTKPLPESNRPAMAASAQPAAQPVSSASLSPKKNEIAAKASPPSETAASKARLSEEVAISEKDQSIAQAVKPVENQLKKEAVQPEVSQPATDIEKPPAAEVAMEPEPKALPTVASVTLTHQRVQVGGKLSIRYALPEKTEVRYLVKAQGGKVVKKGAGVMAAGEHVRSLSVKGLPAGRYQIAIKMGENISKYTFQLLP